MTIGEQGIIFCLFFIIGLFIGLIYDFFRSLRKTIKFNNLHVYLQDVIFLFLIGVMFFRSVVLFNNGNLRFFLFLATSLGILIYSLTLSEGCVIIITVFLNILKILIELIWKLVKLPYYFIRKVFIQKRK